MVTPSSKNVSSTGLTIFAVLAVLLCFSASWFRGIHVHAAQARRRVTVRRDGVAYDREITTFTEDGRLAQVEYGLEASLRGSTVGAICVDSNIVVCIEDSSFGKMHRIDDHIWMLTAGLSGDARMLANQCRRACQNHRLRYGEAATVKQAARMTAEFHHQLTRMGGCRPLGCTAILMGIDPSNGRPRLFRTDPGGGCESCEWCAAGISRDVVGKDLTALLDTIHGVKKKNRKTIAQLAADMASRVLRLLDTNKRGQSSATTTTTVSSATIDLWTIEPRKERRGGMLATCYSSVRTDTIEKLMTLQDEI